jgi:hypothetical protein
MILQLSDPHVGAPDGDPEGDLARVVARVRVLTLDSRRPGRDAGAPGAEQLARLDADLAAGDGAPAGFALHLLAGGELVSHVVML